MKAILVFIDGTICDGQGRYDLLGKPEFYGHDAILRDKAVEGSVSCLADLSRDYEIVYIGARPPSIHAYTREWLDSRGYPKGDIYLDERQDNRLSIVREIKGKYDFIAGIGDRWDDNELHHEIGCLSIIVKEHDGKWGSVAERITRHHRQMVINNNRIHLQGKVEGLARVCPLLLSKFGEYLWDAYYEAVLDLAESSRETRKLEDLASFKEYDLDPSDLRDAAKWYGLEREKDWENNPTYGLQDFEAVEATRERYSHKVTSCYYAELWKQHGRPDIGYQIHCRTDYAWWNRPAWNAEVQFEQPKILMQGDDYCLFVQTLPGKDYEDT
jgi:hypothetical protein